MVTVLSPEEEVVGEDKDFASFIDLGIFGEAIEEEVCETLTL